MKNKLIFCLVCTSLLLGSAFAIEDVEAKRAASRTRDISMIDYLKMQEERAKNAKDEDSCELEEERVESNGYYLTSHPGAYHHPNYVTPFGEIVELDDGSRWYVKESDRAKVYDWCPFQRVLVKPNNTWFSSDYGFVLENIDACLSVEVHFLEAPLLYGSLTRRIIAINDQTNQICLDDGSMWDISTFERAMVKKWMPNDVVIIGTNAGFFSSFRPNILINVSTDPITYVSGGCSS